MVIRIVIQTIESRTISDRWILQRTNLKRVGVFFARSVYPKKEKATVSGGLSQAFKKVII
jgi:hypothetical protein